jgi:hypothetical protein
LIVVDAACLPSRGQTGSEETAAAAAANVDIRRANAAKQNKHVGINVELGKVRACFKKLFAPQVPIVIFHLYFILIVVK